MDEFDDLFEASDEVENTDFETEVTAEVEPAPEVETNEEVGSVEPEVTDEALSQDPSTEEPTPDAVTPETESEAPQTVPVSVMIQQREARKAAEQELALLRAQMAQIQQAQVAPVDPYDDPQGYQKQQAEFTREAVRAEVAMARFEDSLSRGREKYGQEALEELGDWVDQQIALDPSFEQRAMLQADPVEWSVAERNRRNRLQEFETDEAGYVQRRAMELGLIGASAPVQNQPIMETPTQTLNGPKSLVHAQSRSSNARTPKEEIASMFDK